MKTTFFTSLAILMLLAACKEPTESKNIMEKVLSSENPKIKGVIDSAEAYEVQIRYTQIDRKEGEVTFKEFDFRVDDKEYFYPASTVKFPIAVLALEKLNAIDSLNRHVKFYVEGDSVENTFAEDVSKIFAVSDNHANNRLVEFLGQDAINEGLRTKGIVPVRISHRLGYHSDDLKTRPLVIYVNDSTTSQSFSILNKEASPLELEKIKKGKGFIEGDSLMEEPFNFSLKNYYPLNSQHAVLQRVIFPEKFEEGERFDLSQDQRAFLLKAMHTLPGELGYDNEEYYDGYCKFFIYGDTKERIPSHIKIYNKVGFAYGTLTDCAYIVDTENNIEFMLTATILVNEDGIFNDDVYEYEEVGIPFLAELGREFYAYELERKGG